MSRSIGLDPAITASLASFSVQAETITWHAVLNGAPEVPPNTASGTGTAGATLNTDTKIPAYTVQCKGLPILAIVGHFQGPASADESAEIMAPILVPLNNPINGIAILSKIDIFTSHHGRPHANMQTCEQFGHKIQKDDLVNGYELPEVRKSLKAYTYWLLGKAAEALSLG